MMPTSRFYIWAAFGAASFALACTLPAHAQDEEIPRLEPGDCPTDALVELEATCYTFYGEENWGEPSGRTISLPVAVLEADGASEDNPPVFFFPGGPGFSSLGNQAYIEQLLKDVGERTLVTMDNRGFVHAEPSLACPAYAAFSPYHNIIHTPALTASVDPKVRLEILTSEVTECYDTLAAQGIDLSQYNAHAVSRDVEEIRQLLGYEQIDAYGSSTGSGTVVSFIQYHPHSVRAAVLGWPWFNHLRNRPPVDEFYTAKQMFTDVLARCAAEEVSCRELLPNWMHALDRARRALDDRPFVAEVGEEAAAERKSLYFDGAAFLATLYLMLPEDYAELPSLIADIHSGDYERLDTFFRLDDYDPAPKSPSYALGYFLAHVCNDMGTNRPTAKDSAAAVLREPAILGFEPAWLCGWWGGEGDVPAEHNDPPHSEVPALAIHGEMDPCCTTRWSDHLRRTMPNVQAVEMQALGHNPVNECRSRVIQAFLADPLQPVDTSCRTEVEREAWVID